MGNLDLRFPMRFICASPDFCDVTHPIPAPYLRKSFNLDEAPRSAKALICGLGFYDLYINGQKITKGPLAPYFAVPDHILYYDRYELAPYLRAGENVLGLILGNGYQNSFGGAVWDFDKYRGRGAPCAAIRVMAANESGGQEVIFESGTDFRVAPSPVIFDDLHYGVYYDARLEQQGWNAPGFDDTGWTPAQLASVPRGEPRLCEADPIIIEKELVPVEIVPEDGGFRYDFGENNAGVCRLTVSGSAGQTITLTHGEYVDSGRIQTANIRFAQDPHNDLTQVDRYICAGNGRESFTPNFTYHGFRYVRVDGITAQQATPELLTFVVMHTKLSERGNFKCSDPVANQIQEITRRSDVSNFYYFPTDCPHREKNGWTADASLSAEHLLLNFTPEKNYLEWMRNIRKAQRDDGALPGIVPTTGWGFAWGNGPAWDSVLANIPYYTYRYTGNRQILEENAGALMRYLHYISTRRDENGAVAIGLGDWCQTGKDAEKYVAPLVFTDTVMSMDIAQKASFIFDALGMEAQKKFADTLALSFRSSIRGRMIDFDTMTALGNCQTSQAMALFYGVFETGERTAAFETLLRQIEAADGHFDVGVLGGRVIFHVLTQFGCSDLAYSMITHPEFPSYADWLNRGATTLWEMFLPVGAPIASLNHHFWGDVSGWFIQALAGIRYNPSGLDHKEADIRPSFIDALDFAEAYYDAPNGRIFVRWERDGGAVILKLDMPEGMRGRIIPEDGWMLDSGMTRAPARSGEYRFVRISVGLGNA